MKKVLLLLAAVPVLAVGQSRKERKAMEAKMKADQLVVDSLQYHVKNLAAQNPQEYMAGVFSVLGLDSKGTSNYLQRFTIHEGKKIDTTTHLILNDHKLQLNAEYFPLVYSANKAATGMPAMDLKEAGEPWFYDIKDWVELSRFNENMSIDSLIKKEAERAKAKGATALIVFNSGGGDEKVAFNKDDKAAPLGIPVVYVTAQGTSKYLGDRSALLDVDVNVSIRESSLSGTNVVGTIDDGAASTVIIATPISEHETTAQAASQAAMIEMAKRLKHASQKKNNYVFLAYSASDSRMLGASYWLQHPTATTPINYVINLEALGNYVPGSKLALSGYGSSPLWASVISAMGAPDVPLNIDQGLHNNEAQSIFTSEKIPMLQFSAADLSSGEPIHYDGEVKVIDLVEKVIIEADNKGKVAFGKPVETPSAPVQRFSVSLGVIPDNSFDGKGFKIGGVTPKRLADQIGLKAGDILVQLGDYQINEMNSYMNALSKFKKGDTTTLKVVRDKDEKMFSVEF